MSYPRLTRQDFEQAFADLLPTGIVWPRHDGSGLMSLVGAFGDSASDAHQHTQDLLLDESDPARTTIMLPDWERSYGLPDKCSMDDMTIQQRRNALMARIASNGGQSKAYYQGVALSLGYDVQIREFFPFRIGSRVGDYLNDEGWSLTWRIEAPAETVTVFRVGQSHVGEPLRKWGNEMLECVLGQLKPAHTILQFSYGSSS